MSNQGTIEQLNYEIILQDSNFRRQMSEDLKLAQKFNTSLTNILDLRRRGALSDNNVQKTLNAQKQITAQYTAQSRLLRELGGLAGAYLSVRGAAAFVKQMTEITGQFETQRIALRSMLGDAEKADRILADVRQKALKSPYTFQDLSKYAKQLAAFGSAPDAIVGELDMIANLAAGVGVGMDRIILAWGQIRAAGVLRGQELRQLTETGLPVLEELAKVLSDARGEAVGVGEVFDEVAKRSVSFDMVRQAFENMTSEGGKFYQMQEVLSESIEGKLSNLKDAYQDMLRTIGENNRGALAGAIDGARTLMENYQTVGKILAGLIVTFGSYKAALLAVSAAQRLAAFGENIRLIAMMRKELGLLTATQQAFNIASKANIYAALAAAVFGVVAALTTFRKKQDEALRTAGQAADAYNRERKELRSLIDVAGDETRSKEERRKALDKINGTYSEYLNGMHLETTSARELATAYDAVTQSLKNKYLEEQRAAMTGTQQTAFNEAQAGLWGYIQKLTGAAGISAQAQGGIIARLQGSFGNGTWGATEIYKEILSAITGAGGSLSSRQQGDLYRQIWNFTSSRESLSSAQTQFRQFATGFEAAAGTVVSSTDEMLTRAADVAAGIRVIQQEITTLENKAKGAGLTAAELKRLSSLREDLDAQGAAYKMLTGGEAGGRSGTKYAEKTRDFHKKLQRDVQRYADDLAQTEIDAMQDGAEKTLASLDHQHEVRTRALREQYEDELQELARLDAEQGKKFDPDKDPRARALLSKYTQAFLAEDMRHENETAQAEKKLLEEREANRLAFLEKFGTLKEKETAIVEKYRRQIDKAGGDAYAVKLLEGERDQELADLRREYSSIYALIFADAATLGDNLLAQAIAETQKEIERAAKSGDIKALTELYARLRDLTGEKTGRSVWGAGGIVEALRKMRSSGALMGSPDRATAENAIAENAAARELLIKSWSELLSVFEQAGTALSSFPGTLGEIGAALSGIASDADNLVAALTSTSRGEIASAGIGAALNLLQMIGTQIDENRRSLEDWQKALRNAEQAARMRQIEGAGAGTENIFGLGSPYRKAIGGMAKYSAAMVHLAQMQDALAGGSVQTGTRKALNWKNIGTGTGSGAAAGAALGSIIPGLGTLLGAAIGAGVGAIAGGLALKAEPVFESLLDHYGTLFDEDFNLDPRILDDYDLLDEKTREIVDNWTDIRQAALDAQEEMRDNLADLVGDMADTIRDKLAEAWRSRKIFSAIDDVRDYVGGVIEDLTEQIVFSSIFQDLFEGLQKDMEASFGAGGDQDIRDDLAAFLEAWPGLLESYSAAMDQAREAAAAQGLDLWGTQTAPSSSLAAGIQKELIEGNSSLMASYMNAIRGDVSALRSLASNIAPTAQNYMTQMLARVETIAARADEAVREIYDVRQSVTRIAGTVTPSTTGGNAIRTTK